MTFYSLRTSLGTKHRNSTDQMLFLIKSDFIEHLFFYFCFFFIDLSNFYSNQTKPKKKKKIPNPRKQITRNIFCCWSLSSIPNPFSATSPTTAIDASRDRAVDRDLAKRRSRSRKASIAISPSQDRAGKITIIDDFFLGCGLCFSGFVFSFFFSKH